MDFNRDLEERLGQIHDTNKDHIEILTEQLEHAISECDSRTFLEAYTEAMYWIREAKGWGNSIDQDEVFDFRYKTMPKMKNEFDEICECRRVE